MHEDFTRVETTGDSKDNPTAASHEAFRPLDVPSAACDAVIAAVHPSPESGGPCATCAFRLGTEAYQTQHTMTLARLCVEAISPFYCHEKTQLCRGFIAAANLRGVPQSDDDRRWQVVASYALDILSKAIEATNG